MIDDMQGLFSHASDVYRAGEAEGREKTFRLMQSELIRISVGFETNGNTEAFHAVQLCAKSMFDLKARMNATKVL